MELSFSALAEGGRAGLACMGRGSRTLGVMKQDGRLSLCLSDGRSETVLAPLRGKTIWLRLRMDIPGRSYRFSWSTDGKKFTEAGEPFFVDYGYWKGVRWALYHYNTLADGGTVTIPAAQYDILR